MSNANTTNTACNANMINGARRTFGIEHAFAAQHIRECLKVKQQAAMSGNKQEYRRALDVIDVIAAHHNFNSAMINAIASVGERAV